MNQARHSIPDMIAHVQAKASQDAAFRAAFLKDPKAATELEFGLTLPAVAQVQALEAPADTVVVVLPHVSTASVDGSLSDSELEAVAGGGKAEAVEFVTKFGEAVKSVGKVLIGQPPTCRL